jgi:hypothetical protein
MAAGPATRISDLIIPQVFTGYTQQLTEEKSRLVQSGLLSRSPALDALLAGGGLTFNVPSFRDLDNDTDRVSTDTSAPFADADASLPAGVARAPNPLKTGTSREIAVRLNRNNSWSTSDLATTLAGADPMNSIAERVAYYWTRRLQAAFIATWRGVIADNVANDSGDYVNNISGASFTDGVTNFSAEAFLDAAQTMGDSQEDLVAMACHSVVYNRMQKNNLIDFIPDSRGEIMIPTFLGREVIVDDSLPRSGSVYDTWLFGREATLLGVGSPPVPTEVERRPGAGNGGGQDVLHNRVMWTIHPKGHAWVGSSTPDGGPANSGTSNSDLDEAASWDRRFPERKQIKFARLVTREA